MKKLLFGVLAAMVLVLPAFAQSSTSLPINLNTATDEQILSVPGVGARMLREFKEYRPYTNIEQYRAIPARTGQVRGSGSG